MRTRPGRSSDADLPVTIVYFPGASLLDFQWLADGMALVRCPGCGATMILTPRSGGASHAAFVHEDQDCPVLARIEAASARMREAWATEAN